MTLEERENDLFERWKKTLGDTDGVFAKDGVANEERFNSAKYKVLFLAKETNNTNKNWDTRDYLKNGVFYKRNGKPIIATFSNIFRWSNLFLNHLTDYKEFKKVPKNKDARVEIFSQIGMMNLKKTAGTHTTNIYELKAFIKDDSPYINEQINLYKPDIIICCGKGVYSGFKVAMGEIVEENTINGKFKTSKFIGVDFETILIDFFHPQARVKVSEQYELLRSIKEQYHL
jgi:hypothetical protein